MKNIYYFLVSSGKVLFIWMVLLVVSVSIHSITIKGKVNYGERCYQSIRGDVIKKYSYDGTNLTHESLDCNTYYLEYTSTLNEKENILFLASLSKLLSDNDIDCNVHVIIKCEDYQLLSTIVDYQISYTKSII